MRHVCAVSRSWRDRSGRAPIDARRNRPAEWRPGRTSRSGRGMVKAMRVAGSLHRGHVPPRAAMADTDAGLCQGRLRRRSRTDHRHTVRPDTARSFPTGQR